MRDQVEEMKNEHKEVVQNFDNNMLKISKAEEYRLKMAEIAAKDVINNAG